jgi:hypothetical protein
MKPCRAAGPWAFGLALLLAGGALRDAEAAGAVIRGSALAWPVIVEQGRPPFRLAQRAIGRSWGLSEDSSYSEVDVPEWRSEGLAAGLSAVVPGAGQLYAGDRGGLWFALGEAVGWTANRIFLHKARAERDRSAHFAGDPRDPASAWTFERFRQATGLDTLAAELETVWDRDRQAFYERIGSDPAYLAGWNGVPAVTRAEFFGMRDASRGYYDRASGVGCLLWFNHLLAAFDALRAARFRNLELQRGLELKLRSSWRPGHADVMAVLVRRF